jgi:tetratricopeptide (TPR) repeat protein
VFVKKLIALILVSCISFVLFGQHHEDSFGKYMEYQENPTTDNFVVALEHYDSLKSGDDEFLNYILVANLLMAEFEKNVDYLSANIDSLTLRDKFQFANLLLSSGKFEQSIEIYNILNEDAPKWSCPWRHKGEALMKSESFQAAELATIQAIKTKEDHFDAYLQLAEIQKELGKYDEALQTLDNGLKYSEQDTEEEVTDEDFLKLKQEILDLKKIQK